MTHVIKNTETNEYLKDKDSWKVTWTKDLQKARVYTSRSASTRSRDTLYSGFRTRDKSVKTTILKVKISLEE